MIELEFVIHVHQILIGQFGGNPHLRDKVLLKAAIERPFTTFDGNDLYPELTDKAAAYIESLIKNHPFIDGNKRVGYTVMRYFLLKNGYDIRATQPEKYDYVIAIANSQLSIDEIKEWIEKHISKI